MRAFWGHTKVTPRVLVFFSLSPSKRNCACWNLNIWGNQTPYNLVFHRASRYISGPQPAEGRVDTIVKRNRPEHCSTTASCRIHKENRDMSTHSIFFELFRMFRVLLRSMYQEITPCHTDPCQTPCQNLAYPGEINQLSLLRHPRYYSEEYLYWNSC